MADQPSTEDALARGRARGGALRPWHPQPGEPFEAWAHFAAWALHPDREDLQTPETRRWAARWRWADRVMHLDARTQRELEDVATAIRLAAADALACWRMGMAHMFARMVQDPGSVPTRDWMAAMDRVLQAGMPQDQSGVDLDVSALSADEAATFCALYARCVRTNALAR